MKITLTIISFLVFSTNSFAWGYKLRNNLISCVKKETKSYLKTKGNIIINLEKPLEKVIIDKIIENCNDVFTNVINKHRPQYAFSTYVVFEIKEKIKRHNQRVIAAEKLREMQNEIDLQKEKEKLKKEEWNRYLEKVSTLEALAPSQKLKFLFEMQD